MIAFINTHIIDSHLFPWMMMMLRKQPIIVLFVKFLARAKNNNFFFIWMCFFSFHSRKFCTAHSERGRDGERKTEVLENQEYPAVNSHWFIAILIYWKFIRIRGNLDMVNIFAKFNFFLQFIWVFSFYSIVFFFLKTILIWFTFCWHEWFEVRLHIGTPPKLCELNFVHETRKKCTNLISKYFKWLPINDTIFRAV